MLACNIFIYGFGFQLENLKIYKMCNAFQIQLYFTWFCVLLMLYSQEQNTLDNPDFIGDLATVRLKLTETVKLVRQTVTLLSLLWYCFICDPA